MTMMRRLAAQGANTVEYLAADGRIFYASDSAANLTVTGQTTFANTTPTFLLDVPTGTTAIPLMVSLNQTGTVAGGAVQVLIEIDNADRYNTGGTSETVLAARTTGGFTNNCSLYSGATANAGYGVRIFGLTTGEDISPLEGAIQEIVWTPQAGLEYLVGPAAFLVFTYPTTGTAPTWWWSIKWAEIPTTMLAG